MTMTIQEILHEIDAQGLRFSANRFGVEGGKSTAWGVRVGGLHEFSEAATFEAALIAAWALYTGAEVA